jgi:hypothetical protein
MQNNFPCQVSGARWPKPKRIVFMSYQKPISRLLGNNYIFFIEQTLLKLTKDDNLFET